MSSPPAWKRCCATVFPAPSVLAHGPDQLSSPEAPLLGPIPLRSVPGGPGLEFPLSASSQPCIPPTVLGASCPCLGSSSFLNHLSGRFLAGSLWSLEIMFSLPLPGFPVSQGHVCISLPGHAFPRRDRDVGYRAHIHAAPQSYSTDLWLVTSFYGG